MAGKMRWGDTLDEDTSDVLPERSVVGPDAKGYKTVTEYKKNDKGETVRMVTKTRLSKVEKKLYAVSCLTAVLAMLGHERSGSSWDHMYVAECQATGGIIRSQTSTLRPLARCGGSPVQLLPVTPAARVCRASPALPPGLSALCAVSLLLCHASLGLARPKPSSRV